MAHQRPAEEVDKILIRAAPQLHKWIKKAAAKEGLSMNKFIIKLLSESIQARSGDALLEDLIKALELAKVIDKVK